MIKNIIFDFDGVILDSIPTKTEGFRKLFAGFPKVKVDSIVCYHKENGGMSRYDKIRYFFNILLDQYVSEADINLYAEKYSEITLEELCDPKYIIEDALSFIMHYHNKFKLHVASGADEKDLLTICRRQGIDSLFISIHGSPQKKSEIIRKIISQNSYNPCETILVGDSVNDYQAAKENNISFFAYNNCKLRSVADIYLKKMEDIIQC